MNRSNAGSLGDLQRAFQDYVLASSDGFTGQVRDTSKADRVALLDVNNVYVSAFNHEFDPVQFLRGIPRERVRQFHLAGHTNNGTHIVDTHDHPIIDGVWDLYAEAVRLFPGTPTMIERDADIPSYAELLAELDVARDIAARVTAREAAEPALSRAEG